MSQNPAKPTIASFLNQQGASPGATARKRQLRLRRCDPLAVAKLAAGDAAAFEDPVEIPGDVDDAELQAENAQLKDAQLRARADLENYRKRAMKEREQLKKFAIEEVIREIVPAIDNFERALASRKQTKNVKVFAEGVEMIFKQIQQVLDQRGVIKIDPKGEVFDPQFHEAVSTLPTDDPDQDGKVIEVIQAGYALNGRVIRPAMVCIGKVG